MRKLFNEVIIWFFEKYAYGYWCDKCQRESMESHMKELNITDKKEYEEYLISKNDSKYEGAYDYGYQAGYNDGYREGGE